MKQLCFLACVMLTIIACKNNTNTESETVIKETQSLETGCYVYNNNGNIIKMELTEVNEHVTGTLIMAYAEKDANQGNFAGKLQGDKLIGTYTFQSEGIESSREVAFLVQGDQLIEGYGTRNADGTNFEDVSDLSYTSTMPLKKTACK